PPALRLGLVPEVFFDRISHFSANIRFQTPKILDGFRRQLDLEPHSGYSIAKLPKRAAKRWVERSGEGDQGAMARFPLRLGQFDELPRAQHAMAFNPVMEELLVPGDEERGRLSGE